MYRLHFLFLLFFPLFLTAQTEWKKAYDEENLLIYTRKTSDNLFEFKASTTYDYSVEEILAVIRDHKKYPDWSYKTKELRILERLNKDEHYAYSIVDFPFPLKDRDLVMLSSTTYQSDKSVLIQLKAMPKKIAKTDYVRIQKVRGFWKLIPLSDKKTKVVYQIASESIGLPDWVIEIFALEAPKNNLKGLRRMAAKLK